MQTTAIVNYHVADPGQQAFHIDAGGEDGNLISPKLAPTKVSVRDARDGIALNFARDSVAFASNVSTVTDYDTSQNWEDTYNQELRALLAREIAAKETIVFDHTVRIDDPNALRKPARNVHGDYSTEGAHRRLRDLLGDKRAEEWEAGHFAFVNVWRPVGNSITSAPLGFVRPESVAEDDWLQIKLIYPDRTGSILGLLANDDHEWIYVSNMTPDEVLLFNIYDNRGQHSVAHSALDLMEDTAVKAPRRSIESRTLVRY